MATYNKVFFILVACVLCAVVCLNVTLDIYRVFGLCTWNTKYLNVNVNFLKAAHLKTYRDHDAFIVGSSRANFLDARLASKLSGHDYYSLATAAEKLDRILQKLSWLKAEGIPMRQVILALDFDFMFLAEDLSESALSAKEHPAVSGESGVSFYLPYLVQLDGHNWKKLFKEVFILKKPVRFTFDPSTGHWYYPDKDEEIARDPEKYLKERFSYEAPYERGKERTAVNLARLQALLCFLDEAHIPRIVVINPCHHRMYENFDKEEYTSWLKDVVALCGEVWDFSGLNAVTQDDHLYYESSHFRWPVGDEVLRRIFGAETALPGLAEGGFGVLLTRDNIDERL